MKQLYFILVAAAILAGCQPQDEVVKSHGIKEVHLVQFRYYFPEDSIVDYSNIENDFLEPKPKIVGYTSLEPNSGRMEVWDGFYNDSVSQHPHGFAPKAALASALQQFASLEADRFYYPDWENPSETVVLYCGADLFFQVMKEDGTAYTIGFEPYKVPEELEGLYKAMDYNSWELAPGKRIMNASSTKSTIFLKTIDEAITGRVRFPPTPVKVKYTPPPAKGQ